MKYKHVLISFFSGIIGAIIAVLIIDSYKTSSDGEIKNQHSLVADYYLNKQHQLPATTVANPFLFSPSSSFDFTSAAEMSVPAVVHVKTQYSQPNYTLYDFIFGTSPRYSTPVLTSGSGVIVSPDGYIVTNNHVVEDAETIEVVLNNKKSYSAKLVGRDATTDIALLKVNANNLPFLNYGDSDNIKIGEWVLAIGNPFNLTSTATAGIISAKARNISIMSENMAIESFIQTDAAVNPGNSGGALVNTKGELIGINTAIASRTGSFVGYSFAIPVNIVRKVVADLVEFGEVQRAYIGIDLLDIDSDLANQLSISKIEGVYVANVLANGAGDKAGLKAGDIITAINDTKVNSVSEFLEYLSRFRPGDRVNLSVKGGRTTKNIKLTLQNKYGETSIVKSEAIDDLGAKFEVLSDYDKARYRVKAGIRVTDISQGKFLANGIKKGFIIIRVNNEFVNTVKDFQDIIKKSNGSLFIEGFYPNGSSAYYSFRL